jgi:hypothetical protein
MKLRLDEPEAGDYTGHEKKPGRWSLGFFHSFRKERHDDGRGPSPPPNYHSVRI